MAQTAKIEQNSFCLNVLGDSSAVVDEVGKQYMSNNIFLAKELLKRVSSDLAYTTVEDCTQKSAIAKYKQEADSILSES